MNVYVSIVNTKKKNLRGDLIYCFGFFDNQENMGEDFLDETVDDYLNEHTGKFDIYNFLSEVSSDVFYADSNYTEWEWDVEEVTKGVFAVAFGFTTQ